MAKKIIIIPELDEGKLRQQLRKIGKRKEIITVDIDSGNIGNADQSVKRLNNTISNSNSIFSKLKNTIGNIFSSEKLAMAGYLLALNEVNKAARNAKTAINDMDESVTNLSIAMGKGRNEAYSYLGELNKQAKELGATTKETADSADSWIRQGKSIAETEKLVRDSMVLSKLGKIESADASEYLTASLNGYKKSASEAIDIVDKLTAVDMESASDAGGLAVSLSKTASAANMAGVSFDRLVGMVATVKEVTQDSDEAVGNMFKSIFARMNQIKAGKFIDAETGEALNDVEKVLNKVGIAMRDANGEFISSEKIMDAVGSKWEEFDSTTQRAVATAMAGTYQYNKLIALFDNYSKALQYTEVATDSAGTAMQKFNDSFLGSLEAKQNTLQASFESMIMNTDFSEVYGGILDATTALVDFINQTNALKGALAGLTVAGGIKAFLMIKTGVTEAYIALNKFQNALDITKKVSISTSEYEKLLLLSNGLSASQMKLVLSTNSLTLAQKQELLMASGLSAEEAALQLETWGMTAANTGLTASTVTLGNALKALFATMIANPIVMLTTLISGAVMAYQAYKQHVVEAAEATKEAIETFESISSEVDDLEDKLSDLNEQIGKLDPITDAEDIENLQLETEELKRQLAILKEKQRIAGEEADKAAQKSLGMTEASRYKTEDRESAYGGIETGAAYVTKDEELQNAIEAYEKYKAKVDEANDALAHMAETGGYTKKEWDEQEQTVSTYSEKMEDARAHANELATSLDEQKQGLSGNTDASQALLTKIDGVITLYDQWLKKINGTTEALEKQAEAEEEVSDGAPNTFDSKLIASQESLDKFKSSVQSAKEAYTTLLSGNYSSSELLNSIQTISQAVSDMGGSLNWEFINSQKDSLELLGDAIQHISQKYAESILSGVGIDINSEFGQMLANMITQAFEAQSAFEGMNSQLDDLQSSYQTLTEVLESYNKTGYISLDSLQSLLTADENLIAMLEVENGQLAINQEAYENLVTAQLMEFKAKLNDAAAAEIEALAKNKAEEATNKNADAANNAVEKLDAETAAFNRNTSAAIANAVSKAEEAGVSEGEIQGILDKYNEVWNAAVNNFSGDFDGFMGGGKSAASKAGDEAGDAYVKAFEKEYSNLKDMLNRGEISEAQYLNRLRSLYTRYFKDRKKYLDEYKKYESEYLTGMLDLHNKALSGISTLLNRKISAANDAKDASISALQEEKEAAAEAYQAQIDDIEKEKDAIDDLIKEKNKKIASLNEEIDAIERAAESRKKNIQLEKDQYNLEKMLNNRSSLVYKDGQFIWDTDTRGIMDAREKVREDQEALRIDGLKNEISLIQKEIDLLEEKKDSLSEEQDRIQKLMDESNKFYDNLIKQQEKMWDSIIKGMEQNKSRWEELAEVEEIAKAFSYIQQVFGDLGYTVEDVLNGSDAAFEDFKSRYISLISDVNNNSDFTEGLVYATGVAKENLGSFLDKTKETAEGLDELGGKGSEMDSVAESMDKLSESATTASTSTGEIVSNMGELNTNTEGLSDNLNGIGDALTDIPEADKFDTLTTSFTNLGDAIKGVASALGVGEEGTVGGLVGALQSLSELSLGEEETGIVSQFNNLKTAVEGVTNAISGGGSSGGGKSGDASGSSSASMSAGAGGGSASGLVGAIEDFKSATDEALGGGGESGEGEGSGSGGTGAIPQFKELKTAVDDVTTAIGSGDAEGGESSGKGESDNLIGSIVNLGETSTETLGESDGDGVIGKFNEFKGVIEEAANQVKSISEGLDEIDGKEVECSITVNVKMNGSIPAFASGTVLGNMQIESATYNAKYGKAFANGTIGLPKAEKNALVSEYGQTEMTVLPDGKTIVTDTPTLMDLPKDTVIYNEEETKKIMDNKVDVSGNAHANGTDDGIWTTLADGTKVRELQPGDKMYDMMQKFDAYFNSMDGNIEKLVPNSVYDHQKQMEDMAKQINYVSSVVNNNRNVQQPVTVQIGDINLTGVQDVNGLAQAIKTRLPNAMLQEMHRR